MLKLDLQPIFRMRDIKYPYTFLRAHGFTHNIAAKLVSGKPRQCYYRHIEQLCRILLCTPNDLFVWIPDENNVYPDNLPLKGLMMKPEEFSLVEEMKKMPFDEMVRFQEKVAEMLKEEKE